jgi:hypothetical protein
LRCKSGNTAMSDHSVSISYWGVTVMSLKGDVEDLGDLSTESENGHTPKPKAPPAEASPKPEARPLEVKKPRKQIAFLEQVRALKNSAPSKASEVSPGMVEVSITLAGIAAAIATFLPGVGSLPDTLRLVVAVLAGIVAVFSAYSALWLLARYCLKKGESVTGVSEIVALLTSLHIGPYWFVAWGLFLWLVLSFLVSLLAVMRG